MKPSEIIKVLQEAIDKGFDDTIFVCFDTDARNFDYHLAEIGNVYFEDGEDTGLGPIVCFHEKSD